MSESIPVRPPPASERKTVQLACPAAIADILRLAGLDPAEVGDDWMDILLLAGTLAAPPVQLRRRGGVGYD